MTAAYRLKTAGLTVNLAQEGSGKPLLFLGGSNFDLSIKAPVFASALPSHFTVAAADPRGLGATDAPVGLWSMADYAQDALDILDALGWETADILGESFGAMTALHLAALAPKRIGRMALAVGAAGGAGGASYPIETFLDIPDPHLRARAALEVIDSRFADRMRLTPDVAQQQIADRVAAGAAFMASHNNTQGYPRLLRARAGHDAWAKLPGICVPTLVFSGHYDRQSPPDRSENIVRAMPNATLYMVEGDHSLCFNNPEPVATILSAWT